MMTMTIGRPMMCAAPTRQRNPWAIAAFALSLVCWVGLPIPLLSAALAWIALRDMQRRGESGRAMAQFARAFAVLVTVAIVMRGGHTDWLRMLHW